MQPAITATMTISSWELCETIIDKISSTGKFTTVPDRNPDDIAPVALVLLCLYPDPFGMEDDTNVTHIGIVKKGQRVATGLTRVNCTDIVQLPKIPLDLLISKMPNRLLKHSMNVFGSSYQKVSKKAGEELFIALLSLCPEQENAIKKLADKIYNGSTFYKSSRSEDAAAEKDALGICLDIFGIDRAEVLGSWSAGNADFKNALGQSFLNGLSNYIAYEDDLIQLDAHRIPGWEIIAENIAGIVEFKNQDQERLTVINANRKPLEKALGVDLIYFHRKYEAFTLVQYKMMDQKTVEGTSIYFNPREKSHNAELQRMQELYDLLLKEKFSGSLNDFRLGNCPIFFKVCKKLQLKADDTSIAAGAYIPLDMWNILLKDTSIIGPKGGIQIGYHTLGKRYLGTQVFIELMQRGFLGTHSIGSGKIGLFIEAAVKQGHSVMYAIDSRKNMKTK